MTSTLPTQSALPTDKELVLKVIPMPADCNANGDIFGGWVMAQVDLAGSVLPARHVQGRMATVAVNEFVFKQPVRVGRHPLVLFHHHAHRPHIGDRGGGSVCGAIRGPGPLREGDGSAAHLRRDRRLGQAAAGSAPGGDAPGVPAWPPMPPDPDRHHFRGPCPAAAPQARARRPLRRLPCTGNQAASGCASPRETFAAEWFWERTEPTVPASISPASCPPSSITTLP